MKIKRLLTLIMVLYLSGCKNELFHSQDQINTENISISLENKLNQYPSYHTDIIYKYSKEIFGQSIRADLPKEEFKNIPNSDFVEFVIKAVKPMIMLSLFSMIILQLFLRIPMNMLIMAFGIRIWD